jgi:hypothetical protein
MALSSDHLELSARLGSRHRRVAVAPVPRGARRGRWDVRRRGSRLGRGRAFLGGVDAHWQRSTVKASYSRNGAERLVGRAQDVPGARGRQREGGKGRGFSAEQVGIDLAATLRGGSGRAMSACGSSSSRPSTPSAWTSKRTRRRSSRRWSVTWGRASSGWPSTTTTPTTPTSISSFVAGTPGARASGSIRTTSGRGSAGAARTSRPRSSAFARSARSCRREGSPSSGSTSLSDPHVPVAVSDEPGTVITGWVVGTGLADELRDRRFLLLQTRDRLHYIPQSAATQPDGCSDGVIQALSPDRVD